MFRIVKHKLLVPVEKHTRLRVAKVQLHLKRHRISLLRLHVLHAHHKTRPTERPPVLPEPQPEAVDILLQIIAYHAQVHPLIGSYRVKHPQIIKLVIVEDLVLLVIDKLVALVHPIPEDLQRPGTAHPTQELDVLAGAYQPVDWPRLEHGVFDVRLGPDSGVVVVEAGECEQVLLAGRVVVGV